MNKIQYEIVLKREVRYGGELLKTGSILTVSHTELPGFKGSARIVKKVKIAEPEIDARHQMVVLEKENLFRAKYFDEWSQFNNDNLRQKINDILYDFEFIREEIKDIQRGGDRFAPVRLSYPSKSSGSPVEATIITVNDCIVIKDIVEQAIYSLNSDTFDILVKRYWDNMTQKAIMAELEIWDGKLRRIIAQIQYEVIGALIEGHVSYYKFYWFWSKFCGGILRKVC